jgi:hypothetical protein
VKCANLGTEACGLNTSMHMTNNVSGNVEALFDKSSNKVHCSWGSGLSGAKSTGSWKGVSTMLHPTGTEAIKVE